MPWISISSLDGVLYYDDHRKETFIFILPMLILALQSLLFQFISIGISMASAFNAYNAFLSVMVVGSALLHRVQLRTVVGFPSTCWKSTLLGWISNHWLEIQPVVGNPPTTWLEFHPPRLVIQLPDSCRFYLNFVLFD